MSRENIIGFNGLNRFFGALNSRMEKRISSPAFRRDPALAGQSLKIPVEKEKLTGTCKRLLRGELCRHKDTD